MPRSKRDKVISLTKTGKKATKESRAALIDEVRSLANSSDYVWLFSIEHFRNQHLQEIRKAWKPSRCVWLVTRLCSAAVPAIELLRACRLTLMPLQDTDGTERGHAGRAGCDAGDRASTRVQSDRRGALEAPSVLL